MLAWHPKPGECLLIDSGPVGKHLFVIVLEKKVANQHQVISVPVCTARKLSFDNACIIQPGEHPFVKNESFVEYRNAREDCADDLVKRVQQQLFTLQGQVTPDLLNKIKNGLAKSIFAPRHIKDLVLAK